MNLDKLFEVACKRGEEQAKREKECKQAGGHYKDKNTTCNNKPA